jgi:hypothetical protein
MSLIPYPYFKFRPTACALYVILSMASHASAADLDIVVSEQDRKSNVTPLCAGLVKLTTALSREEKYHKALCLKFGIDTPLQTAAAVDLLREAALQGSIEAQLALADTLQQGDASEQREALHWYERAGESGDSRAVSRAARLSLRLKIQADTVDTSPNPYSSDDEDRANLPKGYHCHRYGRGQQVCHGGMFD